MGYYRTSGLAIVGIISFTFFAIGFALLSPYIVCLASVSYFLAISATSIAGYVVSLFGEKWLKACEMEKL